jgi:hypothetical protein
MSYDIVLGDLGPEMPITLQDDGGAFVLNTGTDTVFLHYNDPSGANHIVALEIIDAPTGACTRTWVAGDLPVIGAYIGQVKVLRSGDPTFPRSFPNAGDKIIWWCNVSI